MWGRIAGLVAVGVGVWCLYWAILGFAHLTLGEELFGALMLLAAVILLGVGYRQFRRQ